MTRWNQHLLTLFASFYESDTEGTNFGMMFHKVVLRVYNVHVLYCTPGSPYVTCVRFELEKGPKVTLCG